MKDAIPANVPASGSTCQGDKSGFLKLCHTDTTTEAEIHPRLKPTEMPAANRLKLGEPVVPSGFVSEKACARNAFIRLPPLKDITSPLQDGGQGLVPEANLLRLELGGSAIDLRVLLR